MEEHFQDEILAFQDYREYNIAYPVIVTHWEIKQVHGLNRQYLQIYFQKLDENVKAFQLNISCYSVFGKELEQLSDISIQEVDKKGIEFSEVMPLSCDTRKVEIAICQCLLTGGSIIEKRSRQMVVANTFQPFAEEDREAGKRLLPSAIGYPIDNATHWYCVCGKLNVQNQHECIACKANKNAILQTITEEGVQKEREKIQIELAEKGKKKRQQIKIVSIVCAAVAATCILIGSLVGTLAPLQIVKANGMTFRKDKKGYVLTSYDRDSTTVVIPAKVRGVEVVEIGRNAFRYCTGLASVTIPDSVMSIGEWAFGHSGLTSVTIPNSVTSIGMFAFAYCSGLTSVTISDSVMSIDSWAFSNCENLTIYCEVAEKPSDWSYYWNYDNYPVVWGYKG